MQRLESIEALRQWRAGVSPKTVGFVPTMGALHAGHASLIRESTKVADATLVSIFVNPTQFNNPDDLKAYPSPLEADLTLCRELGAGAVFLPCHAQLYPDEYTYRVSETKASKRLEGAVRPGHFQGVLTVVLKLLLLAKADMAFFGEKDWQQLELVRGMVKAFFLETQIVAVPTVREKDGLALSSRNVRLSPQARERAPAFHRLLSSGATCDAIRRDLEACGFKVEYVEEQDGRRLGAVELEGVRLIDNLPVPKREDSLSQADHDPVF
jgi:pantoate--beta-alanine ligase